MSRPLIARLARGSFAAASLGILLASAIRQIESTGAIPADEFYAAGILYDAMAWVVPLAKVLGVLTALLFVVEAWLERARRAAPALAIGIAACVAVAGFSSAGPLVALATLLLATKVVFDREHTLARQPMPCPEADQALEALRWRDLGWFALCLSFLCAVSALGLTLSESVVYTAQFAPELFGPDDLSRFRWWLPELSAQFGAHWGVLYVLPLLAFKLIQPRLRGRVHASTTAAVLIAAVLASLLHACTMVIVGDEIRETGAFWESVAMATLLGLFWMECILSRFPERGESFGFSVKIIGRAWTVAALAPLFVPTAWFPGFLRRLFRSREWTFFAVHAAGAGALLGFLAHTSYPELDDFRSFFITVGVLVAVHVGSFGLLALGAIFWEPRGRRFRVAVAAVGLVVGGVFLVRGFAPLGSTTSMILHEYSRFGFVVKESSLRRRFLAPNRLGLDAISEERIEAEAPRRRAIPLAEAAFEGPRLPPVLFILWDAGRPDRMGCYGYRRPEGPTTPRVDEMAADAVIFDQAYTMATATTCSVRHTFTGCYSSRFMLAQDHRPFFVHLMRAAGYKKYFITALGSDYNGVSMEAFFRQGPPLEVDGAEFINLGRHPRGIDEEAPDYHKVNGVMQAWRDAVAQDGPDALYGTFTFLHLTGTHFPWGTNKPELKFGTSQSDLYDGEVLKCDEITGQCLDVLRELGVYDDTIIALFADHGTGLMDHGRYAGFLPYEEQIRVPLILKVPGIQPRHSEEVVGLIDLAPTILDLVAGIQPRQDSAFDGLSLRPLLEGETDTLDRDYVFSLCAFEDAYAIIERGRWKMHYHRAYDYALLFDLHNDPLERRNVHDENPEVVARLTERLEAFLWKGKGRYANPYHYRAWTDYDGP